jgi:AcrR family transcriptional regulator
MRASQTPADPTARLTPEAKLLATARRLFCSDGIHATGVARILKDSGVARRTLYERFGSKENLLRAVFDAEAQMWFRWFDADLPARSSDPAEQLLGLFDLLNDWFEDSEFFGCIFVNAVAEHEKETGWVRDTAMAHRSLVNGRLQRLLKRADVRQPARATEKISLVIDGAIITAMVTGQASAAMLAKSIAQDILAGTRRQR